LKKVIALQPDFEKADISNKLYAVAIYNFNDGLTAFKNSNYEKSYQQFGEVADIHNMDAGKRFALNKEFDTVSRQSALYQGYCAYYQKNYDGALPFFEKAKTDPVVANTNVYLMLADIYKQKKDLASQQKVLADGRKAYPQDKAIQNAEINAFILAGKSTELVAKLEDAIKSDGQNPDLLYILGTAYNQMANPKDGDKDLPKPANFAELFTKAENAYKSALYISPDHLDANYNAGALYYNRAVNVNDKMNGIADSKAAADVKKWEGYKKERDEWFEKAIPYLEKTVAIYDGKTGSISAEDKQTYLSAMISLKQCYGSLNKSDKFMEIKKKIEAAK
jgi:tetratricopeptide (TPR) repeat protein